MLNWVIGVLILLLLIPAALSIFSRFQQTETGLVSGRLRKCPDTPNCITSEDRNHPSFAEPVFLNTPPEVVWKKVDQTVRDMGGTIVMKSETYLHAIFVSPLFRFVDDLELRLDREEKTIHFRSSSRTGYSDMGVNRKRIEEFRQRISG
ncbi:MAG: DUF1499 domain-containing protein [Desulfobulbaceae bacterium]|nr:DUF1499 domain-containing protein [Desulfobulbaceae bacterium]